MMIMIILLELYDTVFSCLASMSIKYEYYPPCSSQCQSTINRYVEDVCATVVVMDNKLVSLERCRALSSAIRADLSPVQ